MFRFRFRYPLLLSAVALALIIGGLGAIALNAGSFPVVTHAESQNDHVDAAGEARMPGDGKWNCFQFNGEWICVPKIGGLPAQQIPEHLASSSPMMPQLQAFSSEPVPGGGRPSSSG